MPEYNYRIMYGGKTIDGKYTESMLEFSAETEVQSEEDVIDVLRSIGLEHGYSEVALKKIEQIIEQEGTDTDDVEG